MKKWLNWIALVLVFAIACGFLANWQFSRRDAKLASIELVKNNYLQPPVELNVLIEGTNFVLPQSMWRSVTIEGSYQSSEFLLVRNRPNDGQPGFELLVPFLTESFGVIYVSRGWLPSGSNSDYPDQVPVPAETKTTVVGRIIAAEPILNRSAPKGQIASINIELANDASGLVSTFTNGYLRVVSETPSVGKLPKPMPAPTVTEGNNLSYAVQWILFALMATIALAWRIRRDSMLEKGIPIRKKIRRSDLDAAFEDESTTAK